MGREKRRSPRVEVSIPVRIIIHEKASKTALAESSGRISDISRYGLRLTIAQAKVGQWHIFYSFQENEKQNLCLKVQAEGTGPGEITDFELPVRPVWFDRRLSYPGKPFQLGMEFLSEPAKEVLDWLNRMIGEGRQPQRSSWWARLLGR